jgi:hypothetical protein
VLTSLRGEIDQHVMRSINNANQDIVHRLYDAVSAMANRLYASNNVRMDVADNVRELCGLLPKLNFSNDPQLVHILEQAKRHLAVHTGNDLKESGASLAGGREGQRDRGTDGGLHGRQAAGGHADVGSRAAAAHRSVR